MAEDRRFQQYRYDPSLDLKSVAAELYEEVGNVSMTLIRTKIKRAQSMMLASNDSSRALGS